MPEQSEPVKPNDFVMPSDEELQEMRNKAVAEMRAAKHSWRQRGGWLVCYSCTYPHRARIPAGFGLTGIDNKGQPIVERLKQG